MLTLFNQMYLDVRIMEKERHGIVVCIPKTEFPSTTAGFRPVTWLNTDDKILVPVSAQTHYSAYG
jgi:hypothetical protein